MNNYKKLVRVKSYIKSTSLWETRKPNVDISFTKLEDLHVHEKVLVLFQESFNASTVFMQLRHFLLDVSQEVRVGPIKAKLPHMASTCCCDLLSQLNWPIPRQLKTMWYFSQQVNEPISRVWHLNKKSKSFCSFHLRLIISGVFVE